MEGIDEDAKESQRVGSFRRRTSCVAEAEWILFIG